jgi:hypothetical protein
MLKRTSHFHKCSLQNASSLKLLLHKSIVAVEWHITKLLLLSTERQHPIATIFLALSYPLRSLPAYSRSYGISRSNCYAYIISVEYPFRGHAFHPLWSPPLVSYVSTILVEPTHTHSFRCWYLLETPHYHRVPTPSAPVVVFG